jgi:5-methylcytosine-specific restriction endonuclease McrA
MPDRRPTARQKRTVAERAAGCCEYCLSPVTFSPDPFAVEHIQPLAEGGPTRLPNLAYSCQGGNNAKYTHTSALDPTTGEQVPLYHPREHRWHDHFAWSADFLELVGRTPIGRATVAQLHLNRPGIRNLRRLLRLAGEHPPRRMPESGPL